MGETAPSQRIRRILLTGVSGNLGYRLAPLLERYEVVSADLYPPPAGVRAGEFHRVDLSAPEGRAEVARLVRETDVDAVVHLAFVVDQVRSGIPERERMRSANVDGTRALLEAVAEANRSGPRVRLFVYPSSVSAYGPNYRELIREDTPLAARSLPYGVDKRDTDLLCQQMHPRLGGCALYIFRPHIFAGRGVQNWLIDAVRGRASGRGAMARWAQRRGWRMPALLPASAAGKNRIQLVHVEDVARTLAWTLGKFRAGAMEIFNLAGEGALTLEECVLISGVPIVRLPGEAAVRTMLRVFYALGLSAVPAEALPYFTGSSAMDTSRLQTALGNEYAQVMRYSTRAALEDSLI